MELLWAEANEIWEGFRQQPQFRELVTADYAEVFRALAKMRGRVQTVLEWGSGLGVITIMASCLGFEAYGLEAEPKMVDWSQTLSRKYGADAQFVCGSFVPAEYEWDPQYGDENFRTRLDLESGYEELDMELRDFELVYSFPWPEEQSLHRDIMRTCGAPGALLMTYDYREGITLSHCRGADEEYRPE